LGIDQHASDGEFAVGTIGSLCHLSSLLQVFEDLLVIFSVHREAPWIACWIRHDPFQGIKMAAKQAVM
jgi:hypothetical protein